MPGVFAEVRRRQRECHRQAKADASNLRDELRVALWRRGLPTELNEDLVERLLRGHDAQELTEEAAALLILRRRLGLTVLALTDDAGAVWIVEACEEKSFYNGGRGAVSDVNDLE